MPASPLTAFAGALLRTTACTALIFGSAEGAATAGDFRGFDPTAFGGEMLSTTQLRAMVSDAMKKTRPKDGKTYVFGFANLQRNIPFGILTEKGIEANAAAAGIRLVIADNRLDGPAAVANAQSFVRQNVDFVIEFQTDEAFGPAVSKVFKDAGIKVIAIDIPMPDAAFFGVNNPRSGFLTGSYLGQAAVKQFGRSNVLSGYLVDGGLPQSGVIPALRTRGQLAGFNAAVPGFAANHILQIDTKNTLQESYSQMTAVLPRIPHGVPIMVTAINDQSAIGMLRAVKAAGRADDLIVVGSGADEAQALATEDLLVASTGSFPGRYGNYLIPMALDELAGNPVPPAVFVHHVMVTKSNICKYDRKYPCTGKDAFGYVFAQADFAKYLATLHADPALTRYSTLLPAK
jgi:ribose transport system substrate-binding protein